MLIGVFVVLVMAFVVVDVGLLIIGCVVCVLVVCGAVFVAVRYGPCPGSLRQFRLIACQLSALCVGWVVPASS